MKRSFFPTECHCAAYASLVDKSVPLSTVARKVQSYSLERAFSRMGEAHFLFSEGNMAQQIKSKQRVADHGEVMTGEREVNAMLDLVKQETERVDSRFLEPACGDGNFLAEILRRKLEAAKRRATPPRKKEPLPAEFEKQSVIAITSVYGVDILMDNVLACRERLYGIWNEAYEAICGSGVSEDCRAAVRFILSRNILCGNALSLKTVDEAGKDTDEPIVFSEWSFIMGTRLQRKDFRFDKLLAGDYSPAARQKKAAAPAQYEQMSLLTEEAPSDEGELLQTYITDYRRVQDYGN